MLILILLAAACGGVAAAAGLRKALRQIPSRNRDLVLF